MTTAAKPVRSRAPLSDAIVIAVSKLVDDAQAEEKREPSHSEISFQFRKAELTDVDPAAQGERAGKAKRVRAVLSWALDNNLRAGEELVAALVTLVRTCGGFRPDSPNFVGVEAVRSASEAFRAQGYVLGEDGQLSPVVLDSLSGKELTQALRAYTERAKRGVGDAALLVGTGKDLLEATAAHVLTECTGTYPEKASVPHLLYQAFSALGLATSMDKSQPGEPAQRRMERALYDLGCAINGLRNKEGIGHGRPWLANVRPREARTAIESIGIVAELLLNGLEMWHELRAKALVTATQ